ncbi:MAG: PKD domain-containing protein [Bacteroidota bacterium]
MIANTTNSYTYNNLSATTIFRALVQNGVCASQYSNNVTITVNQPTVAGSLSADATVCASSNNGTLALAGNTGTVLQWESSVNGGTTWSVIANTTNSYTYNNLSATTIFRALVQNGVCASQYSNNVTITVNQPTVAGSLSADATVCASSNNGTLALAGNTGTVLQWESSVNGGTTWSVIANTTTGYTYNNLSATTIFRALVQNGVCASQYSNNVTITVNQPTVAGSLSADATVCASSNNGTLALAGNTGNVLQWESSVDNGATWSVIANTTNNYTYNNLSATTLFRALVQNGVCASQYSNNVTITVNQPTVAGSLSADATVCASSNNGTLALAGNTGTVSQWESSVDGGTTWAVIANTTTSYTYNNLSATTIFRALVQNGVCASQYSNSVTITVNQPTIAGTLLADTLVLASANIGTLSLTGNTGSVLQWESSVDNGATWSIISDTTNNYTFTNLSANTLFRVLLQNGVCASLYSNNVTVTVNPPTAAGSLSANATVCASTNNGTLSLTGNTGNILQWESSIDNGVTWSVISNTATNYSYNNLTATTLFRVLVQNGIAPSLYTNNVTITVSQPTVAGLLSADATVCSSANSGTLSITGNTGNVLQWESSADNGTTWSVIANTATNYTYNNLSSTTVFRALLQNGVCASQYANNVTITVNQPTVPGSLSADATVCASSNNGTLSLAGNTGNVLQWESSVDNGATWSVIANTTNNYTYNNLSATTLFRALVQNGVCASQYSNNVTITVNQPTVAGSLSADATVCASSNNGTLALAGNTGTVLKWESSVNGGTTWAVIANTTTSYTYNNLSATTLFRALVQNGVCASQYSNNVTITVNQPTVAGLLSADATVCASSNNGTLALAGNTGNVLQWESSVNGGTTWSVIANTTNSYTYNNLSATTIFRALVQNGVCASQYSNNVTITVNQPTVAGLLSADATVCASSNNGTLALAGNTGTVLQWESSVNGGTTWSVIANTTTGYTYNNLSATTIFRALVQNGICASQYSNIVTITVVMPIVPGTLSADAAVCSIANNGTLSLTGYTGNILQWESSVNNGSTWSAIADTTNSFAYNDLSVTTLFRTLLDNGICPSKYSNNVTITVSSPTLPGTLSSDAAVCASANSGVLSLTGNTGNVLQWESSIDNGATWSVIANTATNYTYNNLPVTTLFKALLQNGVCPSQYANNVTISVSVPTVPGIVSADATVCSYANNGTLSLTGYTGNILQWESSIDNGSTWSVIADTTNSYTYTDLGVTTLFRTLVQSGVCAPQYSNRATITVLPSVIPGTLSADAIVCFGVNNGTLSLTGHNGTVAQWESSVDNGANWSVIADTTNNFTYNNLSATTSFRALVQNGLCPSQYSNTAIIAIAISIVPGTLSGDATVCSTVNRGSLTLNGYAGNIVQWESSVDGGANWSIIADTTNSFIYNNLSATTIFRVLIQNGVCAAQYSNYVTITVAASIIPGVLSADATVCPSVNSGTLSLTGNTGNIVQWESSTDGINWAVINDTASSYTYSNLSATTFFRVFLKSGACSQQYSNIATITVAQPVLPGALSADAIVCFSINGGTLSLTGYTGNVLQWESSVDNGNTWSIIADTTNSYTYNNISATTNFRVLVPNGICAPQYSNTVTVAIANAIVPGKLSADATVCSSANNGTLTLNGFVGKVLQWESSIDSGTNWSIIADSTNIFAYKDLSATTLFRTLVQNGVCAAQYSNQVTITVAQPIIPGTLSGDTAVCPSTNNGVLFLTGYTGTIVRWESSSDNGATWSAISNSTDSYTYTNLSVTTLFRAVVQNGVCIPQYSNLVTITVASTIVPGTLSSNTTVCSAVNNGTLLLSGHTGDILRWESSVDNGATWSIIGDTTSSFTYSNIPVTTLFRVLIKNGICPPLYSNNVTITVATSIVPGTLSADATVCSAVNNGTLTLSGYTGKIVQWESSSDNGATWSLIANTTNSYTYTNLPATTRFRALVQNGTCTPQYSNYVTITFATAILPGTLSSNATVCSGSNNGTLLLIGNTGSILRWESSADSGTTWSPIANTTNSFTYNDLFATTLYRAFIQNGGCPGAYSNAVTISVRNAITKANAGPDQTLCNTNSVLLAANTAIAGIGYWKTVSAPSSVSITDPAANNTTVNGLTAAGTYRFEWTISNAVCADSKDTVDIIIYPSLYNAVKDTATQIVCMGQLVTLIEQPVTGGGNTYEYQWEKSYDGSSWAAIPNATAPNYAFMPDTTYFVRRSVISLPCKSISSITLVKVQQPLSNNTISGDQSICPGATVKNITGTMPTGGDGVYTYQWQQSIDSGRIWTTINNATNMHLDLGTGLTRTTSFRRVVGSVLCSGFLSSNSNTVTVTIQPVPVVAVQYKGGVYCKLNSAVDFTPVTDHVDSIRWNFGDGTVLTTTPQKISHTYSNAGTYTPSLELLNTKTGCNVSTTVSDTIRIDEVKTGFSLSAVYDCGKTTYRFLDTSYSYFPVDKRTWTINQDSIVGEKDLQQVFKTAGSYEAALQLKSIYGCTNSLQAKFSVGIYSYPKADITAVGQACLNNSMELKSVVSSTDSVKVRVWNLGNGSSATDSVVQVSYFSEGKYIIRLTVATVNSCYDSAMKEISINPPPKVILKKDNTLCKGDSLEIIPTGAVRYIWKDQNDNVLCTNCTTLKAAPKKDTYYKVIGYSEYGCSELFTANVHVIQPLKLIAKTADSLCLGETKTLSASGAATYYWRADAGLSSYNSASTVAKPLVSTTYRVFGKDSYNCFTDSADIKVAVGRPTVFSIGKDTSVLAGEPIPLRTVSNVQDIRKWLWKGNATFSCLTCPTTTAKVIMDECLSCTVTNAYGCVSSDTICITTFCPGSEVFIPNAFSPDGDGINDILFVQGRGIRLVKSFRIYNRWGEMVFEKTNFAAGDRTAGWDGRIRGKMASPDVFVYVCEAICEKGAPAIFKGNTAILK